jgi:diguanylate cyclase (GGDEF)-like protein
LPASLSIFAKPLAISYSFQKKHWSDMNSLALALVAIGLILLLLSLKPSVVICQLPTEHQRGWRVLFVLICAFVIGYISFFIMLIGQAITPLEMVVAAVFCGGGGFVFLIAKMSQKTIHLLIVSANKNYHKAHHDELTSLPNRILFYQGVANRIEKNTVFCCMLLDLNDFKKINDTLGHGCGDMVLALVAERIQKALPNTSLVARLGGDELGILIAGSYKEMGENLAQAIHSAVGKNIIYEGRSLFVGVSIGVAQYPEQGKTRELLLKHADIAMYHAKRNKIGHILFSHDLSF